MSYLLNLAYVALLVAASPWLLVTAVRKGKYREGWAAKLLGRVPRRVGNNKCVWLHAVSVGEVNLLQTLLDRIEKQWPACDCVISTTTKTGYALAKKKYGGRSVCYCPLDFSWAVRAAMRRIRPDVLVLAELEVWPNLIRAAKRRGAKVAIVNGRLSEKSYRGYRRIRRLIAPLFRSFDLVATQNAEYAQRFKLLGARREVVHVTGSLKFDGAQTNRNNPATQQLAALAGIRGDDVVLLAGSTQQPEEAYAIEAYRTLREQHPRLRLIIVPRHPERFDAVAQLLDDSGLGWRRRSELDSVPVDGQPRVLLVDTIGELGAWWGTAHVAFVGGSMGTRGGQNMIEPAAYGAAICFGPNTRNFRDIVSLLLEQDAARVVAAQSDLTRFVRRCLTSEKFAQQLGEHARSLVTTQLGATDRTVKLLADCLPAEALQESRAA